jgi:Cft2 family RNA processing exonuclease
VAGVINSPSIDRLTGKTLLTKAQVQTLMETPQIASLKLSQEKAQKFRAFDYDNYFVFAPGMVLLKSPGGHTHGSQMVYLTTQEGKEYILKEHPSINIVISHDKEQRLQYIQRKILGPNLE